MDLGTSAMENIIAASAITNKEEPGDYYNDNGLLVCGRCNTRKQAVIPILGEDKTVYIACDCKLEQIERERAAQKRAEVKEKIERLRRSGIADGGCREWTFENDDGSNPKAMQICKRYVDNWDKIKAENIGLLMYGPVGTGKSFAACSIANALIDKGISALVTSLPKCLSAISSNYGDQSEVLEDISDMELVVMDDIGVERETSTAMERVFEVIDTRIKSGKPLIVTTNLSPEDFKRQDVEYKRIYDRIIGACTPIKFVGESLRKKQAQNKRTAAEEILGI